MTPEEKAKKRAYANAYYEANKEKICQKFQEWYRNSKDAKEKQRARNLAWKKANPEERSAQRSKRNAEKRARVPIWLTREHHKEILALYRKARALTKSTGIFHEVDHVIPLRGESVSGLHVPWNLQIITAEENQKKNNSY